ncbi:type II toxin-antitoxin system prevent-host-death family antitoxin [Sphingobium sp. DEHP117]|uniref:type II toxin-antitoxin system prevent-host-death family antitoxin n=1 Tax=Sphingobium sp. DEHP117 TaxID=2993436 RepID=UPI0027D50A1A|nr:type II toxin-antitoxin system prevent-host-death family antitoxin [Sphingobium sp. DEHP117]MDQ4422123.1 type II toxin-antitoxin system prevent-host-death family antitoxin [Sphingobium sp. DEHP117]
MAQAKQIERKRVPLTKFHNATGEYLDMALHMPIILTNHGRKRHIVADSAYFERIEALARGNVLKAMDIEVASSFDMPDELRRQILATQPSDEEIASGKWND